MEYNSGQSTLYRTAEGGWLQESYCVVDSIEHVTSQRHRMVSSASDSNIVDSSLRERNQQSRKTSCNEKNGNLVKDSDWSSGVCWPGGKGEVKASGLFSQIHRKCASNIEHYGSKLAGMLTREPAIHNKMRHDMSGDDFEIIDKLELVHLVDDPPNGKGGRPARGGTPKHSSHGHRFVLANLRSSTWCDKCGDFVWGMYKKCCICLNCHYTCHTKCVATVTLDCSIIADGATRTENETSFIDEVSQEQADSDDDDSGYYTCRRAPDQNDLTWTTREKLRQRIEYFNQNNHGLQMNLDMPEGRNTFQGFIRVHMNLIRPINMSVSSVPPSHYDALTHGTENGSASLEPSMKVMSFYLPKNTSKVIHISSTTTAQEVIRALLSKFNITDNPRKFALYEKNIGNRKTAVMRKMSEDELPLPICLGWTDGGIDQLDSNVFILQENDAGEIAWDDFRLPELESFLTVLNREEEEHVDQMKDKYRLFRIQLQNQMKQKELEQGRFGKRIPVFV